MNWKELLKPDWKKIVVFIILSIFDVLILPMKALYMFLTFPFYFFIFSSHGEVGTAFAGLVIGIVGISLWYVVSCLIIYFYNQRK
ncbi:MAG: hypothetical protein KAT37_03190 [Candidatus Aenigmarchaeota archaeon]|nr:hypothetical protein [Candidatus Aenigmarchaeota archaeon]